MEDSSADELNFVTVFETRNPALLGIAKSILDDAGILYLAKGEHLQGLSRGHALDPAQLQVKQADEPTARDLLADVRPSEDDTFIPWYVALLQRLLGGNVSGR